MRMLFKQRFFSWFDSYDIYDDAGNTLFTVKGKLAWGHKLVIYDPAGRELGTVKEKVLTLLPRFELYLGQDYMGCIQKEFSLFRPRYHIDCRGWQVRGSLMEWDYTVTGPSGEVVATVSKELLRLTDTYVIDVVNPADALCALMLVLAIDAEKCSRNDN